MSELSIQQACDNLHKGEVIAYPTEAVWGLGCDPENQAAVEKLLALKQRSVDKGLILVAADMLQLGPLVSTLSDSQLQALAASWPGPTTWLIPDPDKQYPSWIRGSNKSVAIRVSGHPVVHQLCEKFGRPIVSTSANVAGQAEIRSRLIIERQFGRRIACIVPGELGSETRTTEIRDLSTGQFIR
jgi:L-threonylcarbamoyladenylate synthase